eukprot:GILI01016670.1.p1 GENE.GILI01016670.1~~GILI01016670.1.p1  ORF type:complete len:441 (+),score=28.48 GILI01016670.1:32-1324(+)
MPPKYRAKNKDTDRPFDFGKYPTRHVVLRLMYHGHAYDGLAKQDHTENTIEGILIDAMRRVRLINPDLAVQPEKFSRCGRTDKGVSAFGNAISLMLRCAKENEADLDYPKMLNNALPNTIRITGWSFVVDDFDARFSCTGRTYRYYMNLAGLDVPKMRQALALLVGEHDFRNFCKMDVVNVGNWVRTIRSAQFVDISGMPSEDTRPDNKSAPSPLPRMAYLEIVGNAFLYHQIRCTVTILVLIGKGLEEPTVVTDLLDIKKVSAKPCYPLADDGPLVLWNCHFDAMDFKFSDEARAVFQVESADIAVALMIRSVVANTMASEIHVAYGPMKKPDPYVNTETARVTGVDWTSDRAPTGFPKRTAMRFSWEDGHIGQGSSYEKLLARPREPDLNARVAGLSDTKRLRMENNKAKGNKSLGGDNVEVTLENDE